MAIRYWLSCCFLLLFFAGNSLAADQEQANRLYNQGCAIVKSDPGLAEELFNKAIAVKPSYDFYHALGSVQMQQGKYETSRQSFQTAYEQGKNNTQLAEALAMEAQALAAMGKGHKGLQEIEMALDMHPAPPGWMVQVARSIENDNAGRIVSAEEINSCLDPEGGKGIMPTPRINLSVQFAYDRYDLDEQGRQQIRELAKALRDAKLRDAHFQIIGHSDLQGEKQYNQRLSTNRALTVVRVLEQQEPDLRGRLQAIGRGMGQPRRQEMNETSHRVNRRVEVKRMKVN